MNFRNRNVWLQIVGWLSLYTFFFSMSNYFQTTWYAVINSLVDTTSLLAFYFFTVKYLFPKYYRSGRGYFAISLLVVLVYSFLFFVFEEVVISPYLEHSFKDPPKVFHFVRVFMGVIFTFFVATSVKLIDQTNRLKEREKLLTEEKLETELKLLKAQINPHFIFNALNNIYSLTYMQAKNAPDSVLKLSEMLRYVFYDCSKDRVPVSSEIKYIENFNAFQQMKSDHTQNISLRTTGGVCHIEIAPMLFIPLIENAFKYSRIEELEDGYVSIHINNESGKLSFLIENSVPQDNKPLPGSGTGLKNVRHRLNIIYPGKHLLEITEREDKFKVELSIEV